jgi:hypothetical protein
MAAARAPRRIVQRRVEEILAIVRQSSLMVSLRKSADAA